MPSPATIPRRSTSDPDLTITASKSKTRVVIPRSSRSSASSSRHRKSSYWISWSNINKLGDFINRRERDSSKHSDLTEETLDAHNKLHGMLYQKACLNYYMADINCSPYYNGLTDSTLTINREKNMSGPDSSPGRESQTTTVFIKTSSSISSLFGKAQELGSSCFTGRKTGNNDPTTSAAVSKSFKATSLLDIEPEKEEASDPPDIQLVAKEKPLRERVSEPSAVPPPTARPTILPAAKTVVVEKQEANIYEMNQKFIFADKYRPKFLSDFICHRSEVSRLQALVKCEECSHVIFEGPPGVGKRTMIWAMLREAFGPDSVQPREECKSFYLKGESVRRIEAKVKESSKHVEINLSDLKGYEKHVIVELMKETQVKTSKSNNKALSSDHENSRTIVLWDADKLSTDGLLYIRWLLERYKGGKVFFCCSDASKLQPIRSLCTLVQLLPPSKEEIVEVLEFIAKQEGIFLPHTFAEKIASNSKNNARQAIRSFEACWQSSYPFEEDQIILTGWEEDIANIAKNMVEERNPKQLYTIRGKLQILIEHDVSPHFIFRFLVEEVKKHLHENLHLQVDSLYNEYNRDDENMIEIEDEMGTKVLDLVKKNARIFSRIEEFIARFMSYYNNQSRMSNAAAAAGNTPWPCPPPVKALHAADSFAS